MDVKGWITELESPRLFEYPPSRIAIGLVAPLVLYFVYLVPFRSTDLYSPQDVAVLAGMHTGLCLVFLVFIARRFPRRILFGASGMQLSSFFGKKRDIPWEQLHAVLETQWATIFSLINKEKLIFIPSQTWRAKEWSPLMDLLQAQLQTRRPPTTGGTFTGSGN